MAAVDRPVLTLDMLRRCLAEARPRAVPDIAARAAVAAVARERDGAAELLFIHRAEHPDDPWSGHMAFPGGRVEPGDATPLDAAMRETLEEVALDLSRDGRRIGRLSDVRAVARGRRLPLVIEPFVFELLGDPPLIANEEVQDIVWVPLEFLADGRNRERMVWRGRGVPLPLPCYRFEGRLIWGLTLQMVDDLLACLGRGR